MIFTFTIFRIEVAELAVDLKPLAGLLQGLAVDTPERVSPLTKGVKGMTKWWTPRMAK